MMKYISLYVFSFLITPYLFSQSSGVGINTTNPRASLDVNGSVNVEESLYLENPGSFQYRPGANLLIQKTNLSVVKYDITESKYGPINYVQFLFRNTGYNLGLEDYNTKIDADKYFVSVQGYSYRVAGSNEPALLKSKTNNARYIEGYQMYAYKKYDPILSKKTWWIKGIVNNSEFWRGTNPRHNIDLTMNVLIYRNEFISKGHSPLQINMNNSVEAIAPLPVEFQ